MATLREQLIRIQKQNYRKNLQQVKDTLEENPAFEVYEKEYYRYLKTYKEISNKTELIKKVQASDIVYQGDYHTLSQSQRAVLRILRDIRTKRDLILCLEMFHGSDQKYIDTYMAGQMTEKAFLKKIEYGRKWPFSWKSWGPIVHFCREYNIPILGINSTSGEGLKSLRRRDEYSARIIAKALIQHPDKLIYVVDGDYHICPDHLPKEVNRLLKLLDVDAKYLIIYQNAVNLFWKLCRKGLEESDVLKLSENSYCVINTMPANKIQSYLNWLDYSEDAYYPVHWRWDDEGYGRNGISVQEMVSIICSILDLRLPEDAFQKLTIYYADDLHFMEIIQKIPEIKPKMRLIKDKIKKGEGFLLEYLYFDEYSYLIYLPNSNINMAAEEATHFIHAILRGPSRRPSAPFDRFYQNAITECLGFFGSKFINERRKSHTEYSIRRFLGQVKKGAYANIDPVIPQVARYLLQHFYLQAKFADRHDYMKKFKEQYRNTSFLPMIFSTQLGYMLGNKLYYAVKRGYFPLEKIRELFHAPLDQKNAAFEFYLRLSQTLKDLQSGKMN